MRLILIAFMTVAGLAAWGGSAQAAPKPCWFAWWPSHFKNMDWERRLMQDGTTHHPLKGPGAQPWKPSDWTAQRKGGGASVIEQFFITGILEDQSLDDDIPVLEVGREFHNLGAIEQQRVMALVDSVYGVTTRSPHKIFLIEDALTGRALGTYTAAGLTVR